MSGDDTTRRRLLKSGAILSINRWFDPFGRVISIGMCCTSFAALAIVRGQLRCYLPSQSLAMTVAS